MKKAINYILLPLYLLWHAVMDRFKVKDDVVLLDGKQIQGAVEVDNIQAIGDDILNNLKVGDVVRKKTSNMKHCYVVSYKEEKHGICLSYFDAGYLETVSYDYVEGHWAYNSTDSKEVTDDVELPFCVFDESVFALLSKNFNEIVALDIGVQDIGTNESIKYLIYCKADNEFVTLSLATYGVFTSSIQRNGFDYNQRYNVSAKTTAYTSGSVTYKYLLPAPVSGTDDGKFLKYVNNATGLQWDTPSGGGGSGTKFYKHSIVLSTSAKKNVFTIKTSDNSITFSSSTSGINKAITIVCTRAEQILNITDYGNLGTVVYAYFGYGTGGYRAHYTGYTSGRGFYLPVNAMKYDGSELEIGEIMYESPVITSDSVTEI